MSVLRLLNKQAQSLKNNTIASQAIQENKCSYEVKKFQLNNYPFIHYKAESLLNSNVQVLSCFFENLSGEVVYELNVDEKYRLVILFEAKIELPNCIVGFVMQTKKGISLINMNTLNCGLESNFKVQANSVNRVEFCMRIPRLHTDEYVIDCAVANGRSVMDNTMLTWCYGATNIYVKNPYGNLAVLDLAADVNIYESLQ